MKEDDRHEADLLAEREIVIKTLSELKAKRSLIFRELPRLEIKLGRLRIHHPIDGPAPLERLTTDEEAVKISIEKIEEEIRAMDGRLFELDTSLKSIRISRILRGEITLKDEEHHPASNHSANPLDVRPPDENQPKQIATMAVPEMLEGLFGYGSTGTAAMNQADSSAAKSASSETAPTRADIVRKHIHKRKDFKEEGKLKRLFDDLDQNLIQAPRRKSDGNPMFTNGWSEVLSRPQLKASVVSLK